MVSFATKDMTKGGGLDDADVIMVDPKFEERSGDYGAQVTFLVHFQPDEDEAKPMGPFYFNVGKADFWEISDDGLEISKKNPDAKGGVSEKSAFGKFMASIERAGLPQEVLEAGSIGPLDGLKIHIVQVNLGKSGTGKDKFTFEASKVYTDTLDPKLLKKLGIKLSKGSGSGAAAGEKIETKGKGKKEEPVEDDEVEQTAISFVTNELDQADEDEKFTPQELGQLAFRSKEISGGVKKAVTRMVSDAKFLAKHSGSAWLFDDEAQTVEKL
jgi:hypothetical protein